MIKISVIDDDKNFCEEMKNRIQDINENYEVSEFYDMSSFIPLAAEFDVALIDILLKDENGIDTSATLSAINASLKIIFVSVEKDFFQEVYSVPHIYFLVKPISDEHLENALQLCADTLNNEYIYIKQRGETITINLNTVAYFEGTLKKTIIHFTDGSQRIVGRPLSKIENIIKNENFLRVHQSYMVHLNCMEGFTSKTVTIQNREIPVSRKYMTSTENAISRFLGRKIL